MIHTGYQRFKHRLPPTPSDIEGPFYKIGAPLLFDGVLCSPASLRLTGRVMDTDGNLLAGAILDVWQADGKGVYDNDGYFLRGKIITPNDDPTLYMGVGTYALETIMPRDYQIADNPPDFRCAHIHFKVTAAVVGFKPLTTQLYFLDDKYNATDHWFDQRRVIQHPVGTFDFVLERL